MNERILSDDSGFLNTIYVENEQFDARNKREQIIDQLIRLDTITYGPSILTPYERLTVALEAKQLGVNRIAKKYSLHHKVVQRSLRDVTASQAYLSGQTTNIQDNEVAKRVASLYHIDEEIRMLSDGIQKPEIQSILKRVPHVSELFTAYFRWRTVKPHLDELKVPYTSYQLRSVGRFLTANTVDASLDGLTQLARRFVFAKLLYEDKGDVDKKVSEAAFHILTNDFSHLPDRIPDRLRSMRMFLVKIMNLEYQSIERLGYATEKDRAFFPKIYSGKIGHVASAYANFARARYYPLALKNYLIMAVNETPISQRVSTLGFDPFYSESWKENIDWAGLKFVEDVVISPPRSRFNWQIFTVDTGEILKEAKQKMLETN